MLRTASRPVPRILRRLVPRLLLVVGSVALGAAGAIALRADLLVGYGFSKAVAARKAAQPFELATPARWLKKAEVGDEIYWLTRGGPAHPATLDARLAVGDRIAISGRDGRARALEVVDLKFVGAPVVSVAAGAAPVRLVQVTARVVGASRTDKDELVRFFIEAEETKPTGLPAPQGPVGRT